MAWWRHDPSLSSLSQRYVQRILRDQEAVLHPRCIPRTQSKAAQHQEDDGGGKRSAGMSNLEWMQLQHCKRWTKQLRDDPYQAIFGASNDMLTGKGLKDWEWIHRSFPKWMLKEMDTGAEYRNGASETRERQDKTDNTPSFDNKATRSSSANGNTTTGQARYPKKVELSNDNGPHSQQRISPPWLRSSEFERDDLSGINSPSDLRRPKDAGQSSIKSTEPNTMINHKIHGPATRFNAFTATLGNSPDPVGNTESIQDSSKVSDKSKVSKQDAAMRESSFIDEFLTEVPSRNRTDQNTWRQTGLQRRLASQAKPKLSTERSVSEAERDAIVPTVAQNIPTSVPSSQVSEMILGDQSSEARMRRFDKLRQKSPLPKSIEPIHNAQSAAPRPTLQTLNQLPEEDIEFLSPAEIRASMGAKRSKLPTSEQRLAEKQKLDQAFAEVSQKVEYLDPMIESQILSDQLIRRKERELREAETNESQATELSQEETVATDQPLESSIDRMKRWLETTGASFAKQFWQDPTEETDAVESRLFFDKAYHYIRKGRTVMQPIIEDLGKDLPASKLLLERLKKDEETLELAVHRLRQRSPSGSVQGLSPKKIKAMESIRTRFHQTNSELEKAYAALRDLANTGAIDHAPESFKRRLSMASTVLHKNTQLSRMLIYSLQTRLEDPKIDRKILPNYKVVADNLLSLRDTQMTLMRLVDHAMLVYGVVPPSEKGSQLDKASDVSIQNLNNCEEPFVRARLAADAHLLNEIRAHKSEMDSNSNSKVSTDTETSPNVPFVESKPLAHSLFRPFAPAFEKLGAQHDSAVSEKTKQKEETRLEDRNLVNEIKEAYEEPMVAGGVTKAKSFEMLKEDPDLAGLEPASERVSEKFVGQMTEDTTSSPTQAVSQGLPDALNDNLTHGSTSSQYMASDKPVSEPTSSITFKHQEDETKRISATASNAFEPVAETTSQESATASSSKYDIPTHYTILIHDPLANNLSITTTTTPPPRDASPPIPLHQALAELNAPAKFIPYITEGLEVISAKKDMLVLRDALDNNSTRAFSTINTAMPTPATDSAPSWRPVNPIDGTVPLSPTGYVGPEENPEQLEKEFEERRLAAGQLASKQDNSMKEFAKAQRKEQKRRTGGGIVKTAIWAAAVCYIVGVIGEISMG